MPGATISGLILPSSQGPLEENAAIPSLLSSKLSEFIGSAGYLSDQPCPHVKFVTLMSLSVAPTVIQFLAVAGEPRESRSTIPSLSASVPSLPAEKVIIISLWFHANWSSCSDVESYWPATGAPHELE